MRFLLTSIFLYIISTSAYAFIPKQNAFIGETSIYLKDKQNNHWQVNADCHFNLRLSDKPKVSISANNLSKSKTITIRTKNTVKSCRIDSIVKL